MCIFNILFSKSHYSSSFNMPVMYSRTDSCSTASLEWRSLATPTSRTWSLTALSLFHGCGSRFFFPLVQFPRNPRPQNRSHTDWYTDTNGNLVRSTQATRRCLRCRRGWRCGKWTGTGTGGRCRPLRLVYCAKWFLTLSKFVTWVCTAICASCWIANLSW